MSKSGFGVVKIYCEEGHEWTYQPDGGGYFDLKFIRKLMENILDPTHCCDECGRPLYQICVRRHHNGEEGKENRG
jgi:hypothetical protein